MKMGGEFWSYHVPYQGDLNAALQTLRQTEFEARRFWQPSEVTPGFFGRLSGQGPRKPKEPRDIREALKIAGATGTRSVLDMERISDTPDYGAVCPLRADQLREFFGTDKPTRELIEKSDEFIESLERGQGVLIVTYREGKPDGLYFAGYSYD